MMIRSKLSVLSMMLMVVLLSSTVYSQETCGPFTFTPTSESGVFRGQATVNGVVADAADCIGAFDEDGNCAGAASLIDQPGAAYIILPIYGDDLLSGDVDEGMNAGESFTLMLYDASADEVLPLNPDTSFACWQNTNGTPLPGDCGDYLLMYDFDGCDPPVIECPDVPFEITACAGDQVCVPLVISNTTSVLVDGATWVDGQLCFTADAFGANVFHVVATNDCGEDVCDVTINVTVTDPPVIECPGVPFEIAACAGDQVCVPLVINDATSVLVEGATWVDGQLCFTADASGANVFQVVATND